MSGLSPNSANIIRTRRAALEASHLVVHPEFEYYRSDWMKIRDALAGEREVKRRREIYLHRPKGQKDDDYEEYLERAVFYNMAAQTQNGMVGQVFRRPPVVRNLPKTLGVIGIAPDGSQQIVAPAQDKYGPELRRFAKDGTSHHGFAKTACGEQIAMGRFGALVDASPDNPQGLAYVVGYTAENIVDWTIAEVQGVYMPIRILLREFERVDQHAAPSADNPWIGRERSQFYKRPNPLNAGGIRDERAVAEALKQVRPTRYTASYIYRTIYRELVLEPDENGIDWVYSQYVYVEDPLAQARDKFTPLVRGRPLNFIPFVFFGASANTAECEKPPLLDIVDLNLKHYRTYAELEHGRFFTALPVYYVAGGDDEKEAEYHIGPNKVWEVPSETTPGILEFKGVGLKTLETALNEKEQQIAAIGGRLMPGTTKSVSESDNQAALREANEQSLLLNIVMALEEGMSLLIRYWLMFRDVPLALSATLRYEVDTTVFATTADARTLRAIQQLYEAGLLPVEGLYENLIKNGLIPASLTLDEFRARLEDPASFLNNPDVAAMRNGFTNRAQELEQSRLARELYIEDRKMAVEEARLKLDQDKFELASEAGSTSITGTRKLGDPEGAPPSVAESEQIAVQQKQADTAAKSAAKKAATPPTPTIVAPGGNGDVPVQPAPKAPGRTRRTPPNA